METTPSPCATCQQPATQHCAQCRTTTYCNRECQKADWKKHKQQCSKDGQKSGPTGKPTFQVHSISDPSSLSTALSDEFLHSLPKQEVYKRLIDSYRLRIEDMYTFQGEHMGLYNAFAGGEEWKGASKVVGQ